MLVGEGIDWTKGGTAWLVGPQWLCTKGFYHIHTGLEPGDPRCESIREPVQRFSSRSMQLVLIQRPQSIEQKSKPLKRFQGVLRSISPG